MELRWRWDESRRHVKNGRSRSQHYQRSYYNGEVEEEEEAEEEVV